jgi:negative regulator of flagellin synthesis FlgM
MKITRTSEPTRPDRAQASAGSASRPSGASTQAASSSSSSVQLSGMSARMNQLEAQFPQGSFDAQKVSEIRSAITEGRYQVDAGAVADKLLASAAQLTGRKA